MTRPSAAGPSLLVLNCGSRTLKAALFYAEPGTLPRLELSALIDPSAEGSSARLTVKDAAGVSLFESEIAAGKSGNAGLTALLDWLEAGGYSSGLTAAGHRIVDGGPHYVQPQKITPELIAGLRELTPLDPEHAAAAIGAIESIADRFPSLPQVACFDTAFHASLPKVARLYAIPRRYFDRGIMRYGFHGLVCESILHQLTSEDSANAGITRARLILAHLGNGASVTAVRDGRSIDTSMGFTPLEGLVMSTRSGDIDPGVLLYLLGEAKFSPAQLDSLLNKESGLLGVSASSADMRDLLKIEAADPRAAEAIELFCYRVKKYIGAYAAVLGGLDTLVFSGGIGEHAPAIRERICDGLAFLGIELSPPANGSAAPIISSASSRVTVRIVCADEELVIARHTASLLEPTHPQGAS